MKISELSARLVKKDLDYWTNESNRPLTVTTESKANMQKTKKKKYVSLADQKKNVIVQERDSLSLMFLCMEVNLPVLQ